MIKLRLFASNLELHRNRIGRRLCSSAACTTKPAIRTTKKRKTKIWPKVEKKSQSVSTRQGVYLPSLLDVLDENEASGLTSYVMLNKNNIEENVEIVKKLEADQQKKSTKDLTGKTKHNSISNRHRKEISDKIVASFRKENELHAINSRAVIKNYLHACVNSNLVEKGYRSLIWHQHKLKNGIKQIENIIDASVFNIVLKGYAMSGNLPKVKELFRVMKYSKVFPNMESYACYLLCLAKQTEVKDDDMKQIIQDMRSRRLNPARLFVDSSLSANDRSLLNEHFSRVEPSLKFFETKFDDVSTCRLMKNFNEEPRSAYLPLNSTDSIDCKQFEEQKNSELQGFTVVKSVFNDTDNKEVENYRLKWKSCEEKWRKAFSEAFDRDVKELKRKYAHHYEMNVLPYLTIMDKEVYVDIMVRQIQRLARNFSHSPPVNAICVELGNRTLYSYAIQLRAKFCPEMETINEERINYYNDPHLMAKFSQRHLVSNICSKKGVYLNNSLSDMTFCPAAVTAVGRFLYNIILKECKIDDNVLKQNSRHQKNVRIFYEVYVSHPDKTVEELRCNANFAKLYELSNMNELSFDPTELPMVAPPFPWISYKHGGYLYAKTDFVRECGTGEGGLLGIRLIKKANLSAVFDALNVLSLCPWRINEGVLDVAIEIFRNKGNEQLDIPLHHSVYKPLPKLRDVGGSAMYGKILREKQKRQEMYSLWCDCLYKLSIANHFRKRILWFPQNVDFRGRVYPVPTHLNHMGGDLSRSMFLFAKGKPLGPKGLDWLKIHLVNLTGTKKRCTNQERLEYANEIMPLIVDSAENPLNGIRWWMKSDEPWQTLACCMEITKASKSINPEEYISHYPVHQDGSCNGLQHYAALGRDVEGAHSVNLNPDDKPNDVYATVASEVEKLRENDANSGEEISEVARKLEGFVNRKVVKQTVMTYVYGVTRYGAKLQILKRLRENDSFPQEHAWSSAIYLTGKTFEAIRNMFSATRRIQDWFTNCAHIISNVVSAPVEWITPLGFPVVQPYFRRSSINVSFLKDNEIIPLKKELSHWRPITMKQKNAFPPNFIHSLDSSHMMLTALHCEKKGLTFAAVHDSYWTHACDIDELNKVCRQQFVALHFEPILEDLSKYIVEKYEPLLRTMTREDRESYDKYLNCLKSVPETGSFDLQKVLKSVYFFS